MFNTNFNLTPAIAYDFSYLPMSPGLSFLDPSLQPDFVSAPAFGDSIGDNGGVQQFGALVDSYATDPLAGTDWGQWGEDSGLLADVASGTTVLPGSNQEP